MRPSLLLGVLLLVPAAPAQQTAADRPHVLIDTVGPDGWRIRLGPTNLGSMLESEQGRALWQPQLEPLLAVWQQLAGDEGAYAAMRGRLLGYGGRIRAGLWLDLKGGRGDPAHCVAVVLEGDGRSDLAAIGEDLRQTLYGAIPGKWDELEIAGATRTARCSEDVCVTAPFVADGKLLVAAASDGNLELAVRRTQQLAADTSELRLNSPALSVRFAFGEMLRQAMADEGDEERARMEAFGLGSVADGTITISTAGPRVQAEYAQEFATDERGMFAAVMPAAPTVPTLLAAAPKTGTWAVGHFDLLRLYDVILAVCDVGGDAGETRKDVVEETGLDVGPDLLAHATTEVLLWFPEADLREDLDRTPWALTFRLRDEAAFGKGLRTLLPHFKPFLTRERTERHGDIELYRYGNMVGYDLWLAVGNGVFVLGGGRDAEEKVAATLDRCAALPAEPAAEPAVPDGFASLRRYLPPGVHGYAAGSATTVAAVPTELWLDLLGLFLPVPRGGLPDIDLGDDEERAEALAELLEEHQLDVARNATGYAERVWRWRLYW